MGKKLPSRLIRTPLERIIYPLLPSREFRRGDLILPYAPPDAEGRSIRNGVERAYSLEFYVSKDIWRDPLFRAAHKLSVGRSVVDIRRKMNLFLILRFYYSHLQGQDIIELGTWRGGNLLFMGTILQQVAPKARIYGLDTFVGMPAVNSERDIHFEGDFSDTNIADIERAIKASGLKNIELVKGDVRNTLVPTLERGSFGLAHIDMDIYDPIRYAQFELAKRMVPGGYIAYDDATVSSCPGATIAVEEFVRSGKSCEQIYPHFVFRS